MKESKTRIAYQPRGKAGELAVLPDADYRREIEQPFFTEIKKRIICGDLVDQLFVALKAPGCAYRRQAAERGIAQCQFCVLPEYLSTGGRHVPDEALVAQVATALTEHRDAPFQSVELVNAGSFFDDSEVSPKAREAIVSCLLRVRPDLRYLSVEAKVTDVTDSRIAIVDAFLPALQRRSRLQIAFGLEVTDRETGLAIGKHMKRARLEQLVESLASRGVGCKFYALLKPVPMSEEEGFEMAIETLSDLAAVSATLHLAERGFKVGVSLAPTRVYKDSLLALDANYVPPKLSSLITLMQGVKVSRLLDELSLHISLDSGGMPLVFNERLGVCPTCWANIRPAVKAFNTSQDIDSCLAIVAATDNCPCRT